MAHLLMTIREMLRKNWHCQTQTSYLLIEAEKMTLVLLSVLLRPAFPDLCLCDAPYSYDSSFRESKALIKEYES